MKKVYFDNVSSTKLSDDVRKTYEELLAKYYCNSDALYDDGVAIYALQEKARETIAKLLNVEKEEIVFTSGASEANSLAVKGLCFNNPNKKHIITTITEHSSVFNAVEQLEEHFGYEVTYLKPNNEGIITAQMVKEALREDTILVSVMLVNNELGLINDINEIKKVVKKHSGTYFHSDLTQGMAKIDIDLKDIDLASFSAHKIHGLKGSGVLIKKKHVELLPLINGGQQEMGVRGGTSNALENIVLAKTLRIAMEEKDEYQKHTKELHDYLINRLKEIPSIKINSPSNAINSLVNISTPLTSEVCLNALNIKGIMVSSKSTCGSRTNEQNRTLESMNINDNYALRVSFDINNTKEEVDYFVDCLKEIVEKYG